MQNKNAPVIEKRKKLIQEKWFLFVRLNSFDRFDDADGRACWNNSRQTKIGFGKKCAKLTFRSFQTAGRDQHFEVENLTETV